MQKPQFRLIMKINDRMKSIHLCFLSFPGSQIIITPRLVIQRNNQQVYGDAGV